MRFALGFIGMQSHLSLDTKSNTHKEIYCRVWSCNNVIRWMDFW